MLVSVNEEFLLKSVENRKEIAQVHVREIQKCCMGICAHPGDSLGACAWQAWCLRCFVAWTAESWKEMGLDL